MTACDVFISVAMPPTFVEFGPFYLYKDREAKLKCQPEAAPKPTVLWYKGGSEIKTGARYLVESDGTLVIFKVNKQDAGQYRCCVRNFLGDASANASAYVLGKQTGFPPCQPYQDLIPRCISFLDEIFILIRR